MTTAGGHLRPRLTKTPMWVVTHKGEPVWTLGLHPSKKKALQADYGLDICNGFSATRVWIALEKR